MASLGNEESFWIPCDGQEHGATEGSSARKSFLVNKPKKHKDSHQNLLIKMSLSSFKKKQKKPLLKSPLPHCQKGWLS